MVETEERNFDKYLSGFRTEICKLIKESKYTTFRQVVDAIKDRDLELRRQDQEKES